MLSCRDISELVSRGLDERLPLRSRLGLRMHLLLCRFCRVAARQLRALDEAVRAWSGKAPEEAEELGGLSEDRKAAIREALRAE